MIYLRKLSFLYYIAVFKKMQHITHFIDQRLQDLFTKPQTFTNLHHLTPPPLLQSRGFRIIDAEVNII